MGQFSDTVLTPPAVEGCFVFKPVLVPVPVSECLGCQRLYCIVDALKGGKRNLVSEITQYTGKWFVIVIAPFL